MYLKKQKQKLKKLNLNKLYYNLSWHIYNRLCNLGLKKVVKHNSTTIIMFYIVIINLIVIYIIVVVVTFKIDK